MIDKKQFEDANLRGKARSTGPIVIDARYDAPSDRVVLSLSSNFEIAFHPHDAQGLENCTPGELSEIEISPSGLGIHFPKIDADLYLPAILEGALGSQSWMASRIGASGGRAKSDAKTQAARRNGKLGGRPKKSAVNLAANTPRL